MNLYSSSNTKKAIAVICVLFFLVGCAGQTTIGKSIRDSSYHEKISDVSVAFDVTLFENAIAKNYPPEYLAYRKAPDEMKSAVIQALNSSFAARNIKSMTYPISSGAAIPFLVFAADSKSSKQLLYIDFSSFEMSSSQNLQSHTSSGSNWDGYVQLRLKLYDRATMFKDSSIAKAVWVAESDRVLLHPDKCNDSFKTCSSRVVTSIIDKLESDGFLNPSK